MIHKVYSIYDTKTESYSQPFYSPSKGDAIRSFADAANDKSIAIGKHPEDFCLFELAEFDYSKGQFTQHQAPISLGLAIEFIKQQ